MLLEKLLISACLLGERCRYDGASQPLAADKLEKLRARFELIPVCPERDGGLPTPRIPSERRSGRVVNRAGEDVTAFFERGAAEALRLAREHGCTRALLKERSPSCGSGEIYDGSFSGALIHGWGVAAEALRDAGVEVAGESDFEYEGGER